MKRSHGPVVAGAIGLLLLALGAAAGEEQSPSTVESEGRRAFRDPVTGQIRTPTEEERKALPVRPRLPAKAREFDEVHFPDGTVGVYPRAPLRHNVTVTRSADGTIKRRCTDHPHAEDADAADAGEQP